MIVWSLLEKNVREKQLDVVAIQEPPIQLKNDQGKWGGYDILYPRGAMPLVALAIKLNLNFEPIWMGGTRVCGGLLKFSGF